MEHSTIVRPLGRALRFFSVVFAAVFVVQIIGLAMYLANVWPTLKATGFNGEAVSTGAAAVLLAAVVFGFVRSLVWIRIYWDGSKAMSLLGTDDVTSPEAADRLTPVLARLTRLLVASCILDVLFLPAYFLSGSFLPFELAGWRLGMVEAARIVFPQAFGFAALILAFLTHQYGHLFQERARMRRELELTI